MRLIGLFLLLFVFYFQSTDGYFRRVHNHLYGYLMRYPFYALTLWSALGLSFTIRGQRRRASMWLVR